MYTRALHKSHITSETLFAMISRNSALQQTNMESLLVDGRVAFEITCLKFKIHRVFVSNMSFFDG